MTTPAGWYDDPQNAGQQRYWDGQQWTDQRSPATTAPAEATATQTLLTPDAPEKKDKPAWFWPVMAVIGFVGGSFALVLIAAIVMVATGNVPEEPAAAAEPTLTVTETEQAAEPEETEAPESPAPDDSQGETGGDSGSGGHTKTMPNLIGDNLQNAQDELQSLGSYVLDQRDASGAGRIQILDSGWVVCAQEPTPGGRLASGTLVVLDSVKIGESCP